MTVAQRRERWQVIFAAGILLVLVTVGGGPALERAAADETEPDGNLSVEVTDGLESTEPPSPSIPPPPAPGGPRPGDVVHETISDPVDAEEALGVDPSDIGGILAMSGLTAAVSPSFSPGNGTVTLTFSVRNNSSTTLDSTARYWINNVVGGRIVDAKQVRVDGLAPDETRRVSVTFGALGQHTVLHGHVRLTPPKTVEGTSLLPLTRDTLVMLPPLFGLSIGGGLAFAGGLFWLLLGPGGLRLIRFPGIARIAA